MGGFAAAIDWVGAIDDAGFARMTMAIRHRGPAGLHTAVTEHASLAEARFARDGSGDWDIGTHGSLTIVGDIRLWNTDALAEMAETDAGAATDRDLLLVAYAVAGPAVMDRVDGDFAFVIWDEVTRTVFAARDRFGTKPLFYATTPTGICLGTSALQVAAYSEGPPVPDDVTVGRFLDGRFAYDERSFFSGVSRVMPAETLTASSQGTQRHTYWMLVSDAMVRGTPQEIADRFRQHLTDAVQRRTQGPGRTVGHLSGGLDSPAIAASAALLTVGDLDPDDFVTVSAVFPGSEADESELIGEVVAMQPFRHIDFVPRVGPIDWYEADMAATGTPVAHHVRDLTARTREIATEHGAGLVLTGNGGDDVVNDAWILTALLRRGSLRRWWSSLRTIHSMSPSAATMRAARSVASVLPQWAKVPLRTIRPRRGDPPAPPISARLRSTVEAEGLVERTRAPRTTTDGIVSGLRSGRRLVLLEMQEAMFSEVGVEVSHPFLDRRLVEFVASVDPASRPLVAANKALVRVGYRDLLPEAVLSRRTKTIGNPLIADTMRSQGAEFSERFPTVPVTAGRYVDVSAYSERMERSGETAASLMTSLQLWNAWSLFVWLESLAEGADGVGPQDR